MAEEETEQQSPDVQEEVSAAEAGAAQKKRLESSYYSIISRATADGRLFVNQDTEIFPGRECPGFAVPAFGIRAYEAADARQKGEQFVLLCDWRAMPRVTHIGSYKAIKSPHLMTLHDAGIVQWPVDNRQKFAFIFDKPLGKKILDSPDAAPYRISEDKIIPLLVEPMIRLLAEFRNVELVHRAINAESIYMTGAEGAERAVLGECLSTAPSLRQSPLYETISRGVAQASGRGPGLLVDDLYALGVCIAMVARGVNLLQGKSPQELIHEKIEHGSHAVIIGKERIPGGLSEFLRGVLNDDPDQRWGIDAALAWLDGQRLSPKQARVTLKAARPLAFHGGKFWDLRSLAQSFSENIAEAAEEIEKEQFDVWIKRNFEDKSLETRFARMWEKEKDAARERLVSCVCMAMDPFGPVRYKGLSIFPDGFGTALSCAMASGEGGQTYGELMQQQLFNAWVSQSFDEVPDAAGLLGLLEKCRSALVQKMPGYGIERVLYMLNGEAPCLSPMFRDHFVLSVRGVLLALEDISVAQQETVLDRHIAAFISVREPKMIDPYFGYVNSHNRGQQVIGVIHVLAAIQRRFSAPPVPGVCKWLISLTAPMVELFNDRDLRQVMAKKIGALQGTGNLTALLDLVDDTALIRADQQRFAYARQEYAVLVAEKGRIEGLLARRQVFGVATGRQVAMLVSCLLAATVVAGYLVLHFLRML
ncbi:MAG: hypothetical protein KGL10_09905 [Alphaproteobacteria bacterium]|nr:hypothetical protein [Alphaproteobacteria bacterium]